MLPRTGAVTRPEEKIDALMLVIDELAAVTADETARQRIHPLVLQLGIWIGLDFEGYARGKRPLRRLRRGVIAFGQEKFSLDTPHDNQGAPACCRGPSVEPGAEGGDGTGDVRTDEPISGLVQFRTVSDVGATGFEPATSTSRT